MSTQKRPTGITILSILFAMSGFLELLIPLALLTENPLLGIAWLVRASIDLAFAYGAWALKPWAWILGLVMQVLPLLVSLCQICTSGSTLWPVLSMVFYLAVLYYLFRPTVMHAFEWA